MTQQGEAEARGRAEPHKEGQKQHAGFRVRADKEGEAGAKASKTGLWGPGCPALKDALYENLGPSNHRRAATLRQTARVWKHGRVLLNPPKAVFF